MHLFAQLQSLGRNRKRRDLLLLGSLALFWATAISVVQLGGWSSYLSRLELVTVDQRFHWRGVQQPAPEVVIIGIDERSFAADSFGDKLDQYPELKLLGKWPWPRRAHAMLLDKLRASGAKAVGFDLLFSTPSKYGEEDDAAWRSALAKAVGHVVIGANQVQEEARGFGKWMLPEPVLPDGISPLDLCAAVNYVPDIDNVVRSISPQYQTTEEDQQIKSLPVKLAEIYGADVKWALNWRDVAINFPGPSVLPPEQEGVLRKNLFHIVEYFKLFYPKSWQEELRNGEVFKNKIVLVGPTQNFLHDSHPTPFDSAMPGVEIHAAAVGTLLKHNELRRPSHLEMVTVVLILAFAAAAVASLLLVRQPLLKLLPVLVLVLAYAGLCQLAFNHLRLILPIATPLAVLVPVVVMGMSWQLLTEQLERRRARMALERQVSKEVADELLKEFGALQLLLAPQQRQLVVFFSDIRNFTTIFEKGDPKQLIGILNEYLSAMSLCVNRYHGTLDKFIGDAIMAFWGAPTSRGPEQDAFLAVRAALEMRSELGRLQTQWAEKNYPEIRFGIGIHCGPALVGEVGSSQRSEYTAIGDTVNTASRIEGANKETGTDILISEPVYELVKDRIRARNVGEHSLKGRSERVELYYVEGLIEATAETSSASGAVSTK